MQTLLVLYMTQALLLPPHVNRIALFAPFRRLLDSAGTLDIVALSSAIFGLYTSLVYLTPILGGLLAEPAARPTSHGHDWRTADGRGPLPDGVRR